MFYEQVEESVQYIRKHVKTEPLIGIILGSGLGSLVEMMEDKEVLSYQDILHIFPQSKWQVMWEIWSLAELKSASDRYAGEVSLL